MRKNEVKDLYQLAAYINEREEWPMETEEIIEANGWQILPVDWYICTDGNLLLDFDDKGNAVVRDSGDTYPWWRLIGAVFEWGSDPINIEDEETATRIAEVIANATILGTVDMNDEYEVEIAKSRLNLDDADVTTIHTFVNGSAGSFSLSNEWH